MLDIMQDITFEQFYRTMGLIKYPFRDRTAEKEDTSRLFVKPLDYSRLEDDLSNANTTIICGNRGSGKTISLLDLMNKVSSARLNCLIDNFEDVALVDNQLDFYSLILKNITKRLVIFLAEHKRLLKKAKYEDKVLLSFLIMKYGDSITDNQLQTELESIQLSWVQRVINKISAPLTHILNYGSTAITNFGNELLTKQFGNYLPEVNEGEVRKIFPYIQFKVQNQFNSVDVSYSLLERVLQLTRRLTGSVPAVFIDKLDEDIRLENDAELVSEFIKDLVCDTKLLLNSDIQLIISVWQIPFGLLSTIFRESKISVYTLSWRPKQLEAVLDHRLSVYSDGKITKYLQLFDEDVTEDDLQNIYTLSNSNPRDLWGIFDALFNAQFTIDANSKQLSKQAIIDGLQDFVESFQFYEYYPRKKNAQRNTNDIYSYIGYLLKLKGTIEFTNEELRQSASTGGSTSNYITGMMNIGLVKKTGKKRHGGAVIYQVSDPKVIYAIMNEIDILKV